MSNQQPHTPTTEQVRFAATFPNENFSLKGSDFDRWYQAEIAAAEQRGAIKALRDVEGSLIDWDVLYGHEQGTAEDHESIRIAAWIGRHADQIEDNV